MKKTYQVLAGLVALGVLVQAASIAFGFFRLGQQADNGTLKTIDENYTNAGLDIHGMDGMMIVPLIGLILLIVSFFAARSVPQARKWAGITFGLIVLQVALGMFAHSVPILGALHGINAFLVLGAAVRAMGLSSEPAVTQTETAGVVA